MDIGTKEQIESLRENGRSYAQIAQTLNLSINTVKSYWRRNHLALMRSQTASQGSPTQCMQCGSSLKHVPGKKRKRYCSDKCRMSWWNAHPETLKHKNVRKFTCQTCGHVFDGYGKRERKFCSRACYGKSKAVQG